MVVGIVPTLGVSFYTHHELEDGEEDGRQNQRTQDDDHHQVTIF